MRGPERPGLRPVGETGVAGPRRRRARALGAGPGPAGPPGGARTGDGRQPRLGCPVVKGVILAGGSGTRLHPLTRITNKHLLPIYDRPMISYAIEALVLAGINEMMLVTGGTHAGRVPAPPRQRPRARHRPAQLRLPGPARGHRRGAGPGRALRGGRLGARHARGQHRRAHLPPHRRALRAAGVGRPHPAHRGRRPRPPAPSRGPRIRRRAPHHPHRREARGPARATTP